MTSIEREVKVRFQTLLTHPINNVQRINSLNNRFTIDFRPQAWWLRRRWPPCLRMTWPPRPWTTKRRMRWFTKCTKTFRSIKTGVEDSWALIVLTDLYCVIRGGRNNSFVRRGNVSRVMEFRWIWKKRLGFFRMIFFFFIYKYILKLKKMKFLKIVKDYVSCVSKIERIR